MSRPTNKTNTNPLGTLFADCAIRCEAYAACGGNRGPFHWASPCGCAWTASSGKRHKCDECPIICRERKKAGPNRFEPDFAPHLNAGSLLDQVMVHQDPTVRLPLFIPTGTHNLKKNEELPLHWAAADVGMLFNTRQKRAADLKSYLRTSQSTRQYLRVDPECNLITVLNGQDRFLESFWGMKRMSALEQLYASGFSMGTGASFSVNDQTYMGTPMPYAHNTAMLMRHHRVVQEIQASGMIAVPNLYWIDGDQRELHHWAEWLMKNKHIYMISRDFTSTRDLATVKSKVSELISMLDMVGRSFHVLIVGTGCKIAPVVLQKLAQAGHTGSVVTSAPIQHALRNVRYKLDNSGQIIKEKSSDKATPFSDLMRYNMEVFERALFEAIAGTQVEQRALPNLL